MLKRIFENRSVGFYLGLVASVIAILTDIVFIVGDYGDKTFSLIALILTLVGALSYVAVCLLDNDLLILIPGGLYIAGFAMELNVTLPPLSDVWNGVNFIGGNAFFGVAVTALFLICAILTIVASFLGERK